MLTPKKIAQLCALNLFVVIAIIVLYSPALVGLHFAVSEPIISAFAAASAVGLIGIFGYGNYTLMKREKLTLITRSDINSLDDVMRRVRDCEPKCFKQQLQRAEDQLVRLNNKVTTLKELLQQYFDPEEMSYQKFMNVVDGTCSVFLLNTTNMLNRIAIFDYVDYKHIKASKRMIPSSYIQHINFVDNTLESNNDIMLSLDALMLEVSKLTDVQGEVEDMPAMQELLSLIGDTKYYKQ